MVERPRLLGNSNRFKFRFRFKFDVKMYILIRESVPMGFALVAASHASLAAYLEFRDSPEVEQWLAGPFYKTICR